MASSVPQEPGILDGAPARIGPSVERTERLIEGTAEIRELVQRRGLDPRGIEVATDQPVPLRAPQRVGEDLVGDPVQGVMDVPVAPTAIGKLGKLGEHGKSPTAAKDADQAVRLLPAVSHVGPCMSCASVRTAPLFGSSARIGECSGRC